MPSIDEATHARRGRDQRVATLLSIAAPGLGQIYNGQLGKALAYFFAPPASMLLSWLAIISQQGVLAALMFFGGLLLRGAGIVDAVVTARGQTNAYQLKPYNRVGVYVLVFATSLLIGATLRTTMMEAFWVPSGAMLPTIQLGDYVLLNKLAYDVRLPWVGKRLTRHKPLQRDDIVVLTSPLDRKLEVLMRVVAIAGDTLELRNRQLLINGEAVPDRHASFANANPTPGLSRDNIAPHTVPVGKIFIMGDNRDHSYDSRQWGFANENDVKGKVVAVYWSWDREDRWPRWGRLGLLLH